MQVNIARNGANLGSFELSVLKAMAAEGKLLATDHVYVAKEERWEVIERIPDLRATLFPATAHSATSPQVAPPPPPPPPPAPMSTTPEWTSIASPAPVAEVEMFQGFPKEYWLAYFGEKAFWYLDKFQGLVTISEQKKLEEQWKAEELEAKKNGIDYDFEKRKNDLTGEQRRFTWIGLLFGFIWLAYRKNTDVFWGYPLVSLFFTLIIFVVHHFTDSPAIEGLINLIQYVCIGGYFGWFGISMLHKQAQKEFLKVEGTHSDYKERIGRIRQAGGVSWGYCLGFLAIVAAFETLLYGIFS